MDDVGKTFSPVPFRAKRVKVSRETLAGNKKTYFFNQPQQVFLDAYSETLDFKESCKKAGLKPAAVKKNAYLIQEINYINQAAMAKHRSKAALGNHHRLMEKFENAFDKGDSKVKSAAMGTLAKMSEASMKAAGEFVETVQNSAVSGVQVFINIPTPESGAPSDG
jgi:hypothetical protein